MRPRSLGSRAPTPADDDLLFWVTIGQSSFFQNFLVDEVSVRPMARIGVFYGLLSVKRHQYAGHYAEMWEFPVRVQYLRML